MHWVQNDKQSSDSFLIDLFEQISARATERRDSSVGSLLCLSPEETGLLLGNAVFPLGERQLGTIPPEQHN